jgi:hypothetical protein
MDEDNVKKLGIFNYFVVMVPFFKFIISYFRKDIHEEDGLIEGAIADIIIKAKRKKTFYE